MPHLLRIDSNSRRDGSHSRALADAVETAWRMANPGGPVTIRDVTDGTIPMTGPDTIAGFYAPRAAMTPELRAATALYDRLIAEMQAADTLLIAAPIYNFGVPAALKLWIDQVVRVGHTCSYDGGTFAGLVRADRAILCCAYGASGCAAGQAFASAGFVDPYLTFLMGFLGIADVRTVTVEGTTADEATVRANVAVALTDIARIAA